MARKEESAEKKDRTKGTIGCTLLPPQIPFQSPKCPVHCSKLVQKLRSIAVQTGRGWWWDKALWLNAGWWGRSVVQFNFSHHQRRSLIFSDLINERKCYTLPWRTGSVLGAHPMVCKCFISLPHCQQLDWKGVWVGDHAKENTETLYCMFDWWAAFFSGGEGRGGKSFLSPPSRRCGRLVEKTGKGRDWLISGGRRARF